MRIADDGRPATRVRYGWADSPVTNLYDEVPLPVGPFEVPIDSALDPQHHHAVRRDGGADLPAWRGEGRDAATGRAPGPQRWRTAELRPVAAICRRRIAAVEQQHRAAAAGQRLHPDFAIALLARPGGPARRAGPGRPRSPRGW